MADVKRNTKKTTMTTKKVSAGKKMFKTADAIGPYFEYIMTREQAEDILKDPISGLTVREAKGREPQYLVDYVNEQYGLRGTCVVVTLR